MSAPDWESLLSLLETIRAEVIQLQAENARLRAWQIEAQTVLAHVLSHQPPLPKVLTMALHSLCEGDRC